MTRVLLQLRLGLLEWSTGVLEPSSVSPRLNHEMLKILQIGMLTQVGCSLVYRYYNVLRRRTRLASTRTARLPITQWNYPAYKI